ncbi:MAG: GIY-YIG nuclease family protein [Candidatus Bipolaricaulis sp.]|nr:GIY-YIG nuclease family protein [Candidatus Bipolaricaulis sp.]
MFYYTYILYSDITEKYYIGSSEDVVRRLERHNAGATPSTKSGRPWRIVWTHQHDCKTDALKQENYIKRMKSRAYILSLINKGG